VFANLVAQEAKMTNFKAKENMLLSDTLSNTEEFIITLDKQVSMARSHRSISSQWSASAKLSQTYHAVLTMREQHRSDLEQLVRTLVVID